LENEVTKVSLSLVSSMRSYGRFGPAYSDQFALYLTVGRNHVRAFRASELARLGGYNPNLPVADYVLGFVDKFRADVEKRLRG